MPRIPEQRAREEIDEQLRACGWLVQDFREMDIHAGPGVTVRESPLKWVKGTETRSRSPDSLLYADGWAVGVIEAKPVGHTLQGVRTQSEKYATGLDEFPRGTSHPRQLHP